MATQVTDATFEAEVLKEKGVVVVDFWAEWCGPCKMLLPIIEELATELEGKAKIVKVDVDANAETAMAYKIMTIPTLLFFKDGELVDKLVGVQEKSALIEKIESL